MTSRRTVRPSRGGAFRKLGWLAAATLLAASVFAPTVSAAPPSDACLASDSLFEYSVDGGPFLTVSINDGPSAYPMNTVTVRIKEGAQLPDGCARAFGLVSYNAGGGTWPGSVYEHFLDDDTAILDNDHRSATLTITAPAPACFGQTDFYTDAYTNGTFFPGDTHYSGALEPHYPDVPTPYGKISGANGGGQVCDEASQPPSSPPSAPPSESAPPPPSESAPPPPSESAPPPPSESTPPVESSSPAPSTSGGVQGATGTPNRTPPPTDTIGVASSSDGWRIVLAGLGIMIALALIVPQPERGRRKS
jgi:hypothetical protein